MPGKNIRVYLAQPGKRIKLVHRCNSTTEATQWIDEFAFPGEYIIATYRSRFGHTKFEPESADITIGEIVAKAIDHPGWDHFALPRFTETKGYKGLRDIPKLVKNYLSWGDEWKLFDEGWTAAYQYYY